MLDTSKRLSPETVAYMNMKNRALYEYCNFHLHEDIDMSGYVHVIVDGFEKADKEWHGCKTYYGIQWLFGGKGTILPIDFHKTSHQNRIDKLEEYMKLVKVNSLGASLSGTTYTDEDYDMLMDDIYNMASAGNAGPESFNTLSTMAKCLSIAATNLYSHDGDYHSNLMGYSSWDYETSNVIKYPGKPVDVAGVGDILVTFYADGEWHFDKYGGTSARHIIGAGVAGKNIMHFYNVHGRFPNYKEINEMIFNFCKPVDLLMDTLSIEYHGEELLDEYHARVGFGNMALPSVLLHHWGAWYYAYLKDKCNLRPIWSSLKLSDLVTRGELAIMIANIFANFSGRTDMDAAVDKLNAVGIPFYGRVDEGVHSMAFERTVTREEFFVMVRRILEHENDEHAGLDDLSWGDNATGSLLYVQQNIKVFNTTDNDWLLDKGSACAIFARMKGYIEWSEKIYI